MIKKQQAAADQTRNARQGGYGDDNQNNDRGGGRGRGGGRNDRGGENRREDRRDGERVYMKKQNSIASVNSDNRGKRQRNKDGGKGAQNDQKNNQNKFI